MYKKVTDILHGRFVNHAAVHVQNILVIVGGPRNSLDRNYNYSIEKDINFIAEICQPLS
jgi:hypothetical protein